MMKMNLSMRKAMKKVVIFGLSLVLMMTLAACDKKTENKNLKVGVAAGPYGDMFLEAIAPSLEEQGYKVEIVEFSDYVQPNLALANKEIDVNMFQHSVYLENFKKEHSLELTAIKEIPTAGMGIFSNTITSLEDIPDGGTVAIPNDPTNLSRSIRVLEQTGLVTIDSAIDPATATQFTLSANPKNLKFVEIEAPQLPRSLDSADIAIINGNYAIGAGLKLSDALHNEVIAEGYVNVIAVRTEDKDKEFAKDIVAVVESEKFKTIIEDETKQYVSFHRPSDY